MRHRQVCIIGGSGFIGLQIAARLNDHPLMLTIPSRQPEQRLSAFKVLPSVQLCRPDLNDPKALQRLLLNHDCVISMAGILHGSAKDFHAVHVDLPKRIVAACQKAGVRRLIHVSALGVSTEAPSDYLRSKAAGEASVRQSGLDWTILRPSVVFGPGDNFLNLFAKLNRQLPLLPLAGANARFQPVWVGDVAHAVAQILWNRASFSQTLDLVGPHCYRLAELVRISGQLSGHTRPIIPIPLALGMLQAWLFEHLPGPTLMSRDNLRSLARDNISPDGFPSTLLGFSPSALEIIAPRYLQPI